MKDMERDHDERVREQLTPDDQKSPERLEQEANQARARLERTVDELSNRLSPGELLDQGLHMVREHGGEFGRTLGNQVKQNPLPLIVTAIGLSWLMFGTRTRGEGYVEPYRDPVRYNARTGDLRFSDASGVVPTRARVDDEPGVVDRVKGAASEAKDRAAGAVEDAKHGIGDAVDSAKSAVKGAAARIGAMTGTARQTTHDMRDRIEETATSTRDTLVHLLDEQPLVVGGLGIALGAALGAMLPSTESEDRLFGGASSRMTSKAKRVAAEQYERVKDTVKDVADEVTEGLGT
jgi:hypothetical protein